MSVRFTNNSVQIKEMLQQKGIAWLYEACGELEAQTKQNMPPGGDYYTQQKNSWKYNVDEREMVGKVGNPLEAALWTEFGTGEHSIAPKGGRKGYWVYVKEDDITLGTSYHYTGGKQYTLEEAKKAVAMLRSQGLDAHYTKGQSAKRPLFRAYTALKTPLKRRAQEIFRG
jgi:hypothetical protein